MIAKFLFGTGRVISLEKEDSPSNVKLKDMLFIVRKHDVFAHSDMANLCRTPPSTGGFVKCLGNQGEENFYGESVSCNVGTDDSMLELYYPLTQNGNWYMFTHPIPGTGTKFTVFCGCPFGYKPSSLLTGIEWEPVKYEDIKPLMTKEVQENTSQFNW
jgi:hypothetical protein